MAKTQPTIERSSRRFNGDSGRKPQTEARRYVYAILSEMILSEIREQGQWMYGGIENEFDRTRLTKALNAVRKEMKRKAFKP